LENTVNEVKNKV